VMSGVRFAIHCPNKSERLDSQLKNLSEDHFRVIVDIEWVSIGIVAASPRGSPHIATSLLETTRRCIKVEPDLVSLL
jgi:hypothetical protein